MMDGRLRLVVRDERRYFTSPFHILLGHHHSIKGQEVYCALVEFGELTVVDSEQVDS
jgi:hypothetical protein